MTDGEYVSTFSSTARPTTWGFQWRFTFYGINGLISSNHAQNATDNFTSLPTLKVSSAAVASKTMALADSYCHDIGKTTGFHVLSKGKDGSGSIAERHNEQAALAFLDGHTELWKNAKQRVQRDQTVTFKQLEYMNPYYPN